MLFNLKKISVNGIHMPTYEIQLNPSNKFMNECVNARSSKIAGYVEVKNDSFVFKVRIIKERKL